MTVVDSGESVTTPAPRRELPPSMVERMTLILDAFDGRASRLTLEEVACRTQLPRSTVHRILDQLVRLNWVEHASFGYCLGRRALGLGGGDGGHSEIRAAAAPLLHELHMQTGMVVHLAVLDGSESVYLDKVGGVSRRRCLASGRPRTGLLHGRRKSMLAWLDPERVDSLYEARLSRCTDRTITDIATLHQELNRIGSVGAWLSSAASPCAVWPVSVSPCAATRVRSPESRCVAMREPPSSSASRRSWSTRPARFRARSTPTWVLPPARAPCARAARQHLVRGRDGSTAVDPERAVDLTGTSRPHQRELAAHFHVGRVPPVPVRAEWPVAVRPVRELRCRTCRGRTPSGVPRTPCPARAPGR